MCTAFSRWLIPTLLASGVFIAGCDLTNPFEDFQLIVDVTPAPTLVTGQIIDAATGQVLSPSAAQPIQVRFTGPVVSRIVDETATPFANNTLEITSGPSFFNFGLIGAVPTLSAPAAVQMEISAPGFLTTSVSVSLADSAEAFQVALVNVSAPPAGVSFGEATAPTSASGALQASLTASSARSAATTLQASITIPAGTLVRGAGNQPLTGAVTATVAGFDPRAHLAAAAFPGSYTGVSPVNNPAGAGPGTFMTAGFAAFEIVDAAGRKAASFDQAATVSVEIPAGTVNPTTGVPVQNGQVISVYSLGTAEGAWRFEGTAPVRGPDARGNFRVDYNTLHLSYFNFGWFQPATCSAAAPVAAALPAGALASDYYARLVLSPGNRLLGTFTLTGSPITLRDATARGGQLVFFKYGETAPLITFVTNNLCAGGAVSVPGAARPVTAVKLIGSVSCVRKQTTVRPSTYVYFRRNQPGAHWAPLLIRNGQAVVTGLVIGAEYEVGTFLNGQWESTLVRLSPTATQPAGVTIKEIGPDEYEIKVTFENDASDFCS